MSAQVNNTKSGWVHGLVTVSLILLGLTATGLAHPTTINVPGDQPTIQAAINAAAAGDTVFVSNGTYVLGATLNVTKGITIEGESEAGVFIDASSRGTGYGIYVEANNVTLRKFTVLPPDNDPPGTNGTSSGGGFAIHCSFNHTVPYSSLTNLALANITIQNGNRAAFDIHGYDGVTLTDLTAKNSAYGNGIQITGCTDVTITGATVSGNAWGGIAFYVSKSTYLNRGCSGITYDMAANTAVDQPVYVEDEYGIDNIVTIANATYLIKNDYGSGTSTMWMYTDGTQADAIAIAQALNTKYSNTLSQVTNSTGGRVVAPGLSITIQAAIDAASPGAMVEVAAGTYHEQLTISKALTLKGSDGAVLDGTGLAATWTTGIKIRSGNVTIDNIDVTKFTQDGITAYRKIDMPNIQIVNCRVSDIQPGYWGFGIYVGYESEAFGYAPPSNLTNHLDFSGLFIANNEITNTHSSGLVLQAITGTPGSLVVSNNTVHGISVNSGIWIDCGRNLTIVDNDVSNNKWGIEFSAYAEPWYTLDGPYGPKDIVLQGNDIIDNVEEGVALYNGWASTITLLKNWIEGNGTGVANFLDSALDVGANYWGSPDGPGELGAGSGDTISEWVTYATYYSDAAMTNLVYQPMLVDDDFTPATPGWGLYAFPTIQQGVDAAASGGPVTVAPGTYQEQVEIAKDLSLLATAPGVVISSPSVLAKSFTTSAVNKPVVYVHDAMSVTLSNVVVDGLFQGGANYRFMGIAYHNAGGAVLASEVKNIANNPPNGSQHGIGVGVYNLDAAARTFALLDSYLHDCQKNCTVFTGDNLTLDIRRNRIFGAGPISYIAQNGIQISYGTVTGTVADNIVSGFDYTPGTTGSAAIMNYLGGYVVFDNNIVTLSDFGVYIYNDAGALLTNNSLTGNDYSLVSYSTAQILAEDNWWGSPLGPQTEGVYGDVDAEPWLAAKPAHANALYLEASDASLFIKPGQSIIVDMNVANLTTNVNACQAMLGYSSTYFDDPSAGAVQAGGGTWDQLIWDSWVDSTGVPGEIDTAIGVDAQGAVGTTADGTVAIVTLTSRTNVEGITQMVFRPDADPDPGQTESTFLASVAEGIVWPSKVNSANIIIDGTAPVMSNVTALQNQPIVGDVTVKDCSNTVYQGTVEISLDASDALAGLVGAPTIVLSNGVNGATATLVDENPEGTFNYTWEVTPATANGMWTATVTATDRAGNETQETFTLCVNRNQISGYVESEGFVGGDRVVTFVATGGTSTKTWTQTLTFTGDTAAYVLTNVPEGTTGLSAKTAWSLRSKLPVALDSGGQGSANFEDADKLRGGDIDNSNSVNVLDYSKLKVNWLSTNPVGDIDGNGSVGASDYSLMRLNWFQVGDPQ